MKAKALASVVDPDVNPAPPVRQIALAASRIEQGRALRHAAPRISHSRLGISKKGRDVVALIEASNANRMDELIPLRHSRMLESPFAFYRGSSMVQAADLVHTPVSGIIVQACGDAHLMNLGSFATPERDLVFDINDFDETFPAPWEWDVKRLAASLVLATRWRGFSSVTAREMVATAAARYREAMRKYASGPTLAVWYSHITADDILFRSRKRRKNVSVVKAGIKEGQKRTSEHLFHKITAMVDGNPRIVDQPPLLFHPPNSHAHEMAAEFLAKYSDTLRDDYRALFDRFRYADAAVKVVGVGSVGTRCLVALMLGEHDDPLFLQIKEARKSVLEPYTGGPPWKHQGERVVTGQRLMQSASDIFLGWARGPRGRDFYVRQLRDMKVAAHIESYTAATLVRYGGLCGEVLARAHAKAGQAPPISGYLGSSPVFDNALQEYAVGYADQVERDYERFREAARDGRIRTEASPSSVEVMIS
jgi:uncharacterized protein (DUF2252 family)